jgi:uncharacterized membrane protein/thiol-disulfide isomerase/thioredoxin
MAQSFRTNLSNVARHYVQQLKIPVTKTTLKQNLEQNPYYPSLYSLSNVFDKLGIANQAFSVDEEQLPQFDPPFITYCAGQSTGRDFVLVTAINNETVNYIAENGRTKKISKSEFLKQWQKVVFAAEGNEKSGEADYGARLKAEQLKSRKQFLLYSGMVLIMGLMISWLLTASGSSFVIPVAAITVIKMFGVAATILLLIYEVDKTNSFVKNICSAGKQTNCDAVINSKAGKFLGMGWGELGFFYFGATTLFLLLPGTSFLNKLPWLAMASTIAAPYIVFSIYYQWKIVKQWCPLCLAVQVVLTMELVWAIANFWSHDLQLSNLNWLMLLPIACCLLFVFCGWYLLKPILLTAKSAPGYDAAYKRLLYNPETFESLLQQQATAPDGWQQIGIDIGNPSATNTIIKVCNPYCGPCAKAHPVLEEIIKHNRDIKVKVIFTAHNNEIDETNKPVKHLLAIAAKGDLALTEHALDDWYMADKKDYKAFAALYPMNGELKEQGNKLDLMSKWCEEAQIIGTPTFFINGKQLPVTYRVAELKNIF